MFPLRFTHYVLRIFFGESMKTVSMIIVILLSGVLFADQLSDQFLEAAKKGDVAELKKLLDQGVNVDSKNKYGVTALGFACSKGHLDAVQLLIERGANINAEDTFYHATPISWAVENGHNDIVKFLLQKGANPDDAFISTIYQNDPEALKMILANAKVSQEKLNEGLGIATQNKSDAVIKILQDAGAVVKQEPVAKVAPEILQSYGGKFKNSEGEEIVLTPQENVLNVQVQGQEFKLNPKDEKTFLLGGSPDYVVTFEPEDGKVNRFSVKRPDGSTSVYTRAQETTVAEIPAEKIAADKKLLEQSNMTVTKPANWPSFRGMGATGVADGQYPPIEWDAGAGKNILWKTAIPGLANSSPVIWGDRVFVTTAISSDPESKLKHGLYGDVNPSADISKHTWKIYSLDKKTGKILWEKTVYEGVPNVKRHPKSTQANSTPTTDGKNVVALFSFGGLYCFNFKGEVVWKKDLGVLDSGWFYDPDYQWAYGSSPIIYEDLVIVQADLQKNSYIAAYGLKTGEQVWKTLRDEIPSWGSPSIIQTKEGAQVVANGTNFIRGYDAKTGTEVWRLHGNSEITVPTPFVANDLIYVTSGYRPVQPIYAIKLNAIGDITLKDDAESNEFIAWSKKRGGPYMPTPIVYGDYLYTCANNGVVTAYNAKTGERIYQKRLGGEGSGYAFTASPIAADGKLYFTSEDGEIYVVKSGPEFEVLAVNKMNEVAMATPAISDKMIIIRTLEHVYGIKAQ
jgi:outer membrane protein assembly factor BamB